MDGRHRFTVLGGGIVRLSVDQALVASGEREFGQEFGGPALPVSGTIDLRAGQPVRLQLDYSSATAWLSEDLGLPGGDLRLGWQPPDAQIADAAALAGRSDVAVVFVSQAQGEGMDRASLSLPGDQDDLVAAVAGANSRTVVVVNTGGPVSMPWLGEVAAVLQAWHPGQQFGQAVAAVLFGDADPGGRLPLTWPAGPEQGPVKRAEQYPGVDGDARYDEGILVGYRWYDRHGEQPLFPFGHGLSYGGFRYGDARVEVESAAGPVRVSVEVANVGSGAGSEVAQLYLVSPAAAGAPPQQLRGFDKLALAAGASATASFELSMADLAAFDESAGRWVVSDGRYEIRVGSSSRDIRADATFEVRAGQPRRSPRPARQSEG